MKDGVDVYSDEILITMKDIVERQFQFNSTRSTVIIFLS